MELILDSVPFRLCTETGDTAFFVRQSEENSGLEYDFDCSFYRGVFQGENISPAIHINSIKSSAKNMEELAGECFEVKTLEEAFEREDSFYIFEHEPLVRYKLTVMEIRDNRAHISCVGVAVTDGYATPYETAGFELDCWLPIITDRADWVKFGL